VQIAFQNYLKEKLPFLQGKKILVAISGGIDSVVLTHLFHDAGYPISLAHCNFQLRGKESEKDALFVRQLAIKLEIPFYETTFETEAFAKKNNLSIQMAARDLRYAWFHKIIMQNRFGYVCTAHHADDNLETFLINFSRGTGLEGLTGIPEINENVVRPLLLFTRHQIEAYAKGKKLQWREDYTNAETKYLRNKLRHDIIPQLKSLNPSFMVSFSKTVDNLQGNRAIVLDRMEEFRNEIIIQETSYTKYKIEPILKLSHPKAYVYELFKSFGFTEWDDITALLNAQSGKQVVSKTHRLVKDREYLLLSDITLIPMREDRIEILKSINFISSKNFNLKMVSMSREEFNDENLIFADSFNNAIPREISDTIIYVDKNLLEFPLTVRMPEKGDYFYPLGMSGKKKLSKFLKDEKISLLEKEKINLLCSNNNIVWVVGKRLDDRFKITENTTEILKFEMEL
jgi:tRNA(Ile)-lysidine synthase